MGCRDSSHDGVACDESEAQNAHLPRRLPTSHFLLSVRAVPVDAGSQGTRVCVSVHVGARNPSVSRHCFAHSGNAWSARYIRSIRYPQAGDMHDPKPRMYRTAILSEERKFIRKCPLKPTCLRVVYVRHSRIETRKFSFETPKPLRVRETYINSAWLFGAGHAIFLKLCGSPKSFVCVNQTCDIRRADGSRLRPN